jgi:hypothetical protein
VISSAPQQVGLDALDGAEEAESQTLMLDAALAARGLSPAELFEVLANSMISVIEGATTPRETRQASDRLSRP